MAKHEVIIHENTGATKESAPYLGSYIAKDTIKEDSVSRTTSVCCSRTRFRPSSPTTRSRNCASITKQLFKGHTAALLPAGDYKLIVKSRAGDAEGPLQTAFRRVKYLKVVDPPTVTKATTAGCADDHLKFNQEDADTVADGTR